MVTHSHKKLSQNNLQTNKSPSTSQPTASTSFTSTVNNTKSSKSTSHSSKAADTSSSRLITKHIKIKYPINHQFKSKQPITKKNYLLSELIEEICQHETQLLNEKEEELTQDYKNHSDIHQSMIQLLETLPNILRDEYQINEQLFEPEISKSLRQEILLKSQQLHRLTQYTQQLSKYQEDMNAFGDVFDLWLGQIPKDQVSFLFFLLFSFALYLFTMKSRLYTFSNLNSALIISFFIE